METARGSRVLRIRRTKGEYAIPCIAAAKRLLINKFIASLLALAALPGIISADEVESTSDHSPPAIFIDFYQKYISDLRYGNCRFEPSCSRFAQEAIDTFGMVKGAVLSADRLVRCNSNAGVYYERNRNGRWKDPVSGPHGAVTRPRVPEWLLPERGYFIELQESIPSDRQTEYAAFADELAGEGDCRQAATEYKRVAFLSGSRELNVWSHMMTGNCHFRWNEWEQAEREYVKAAEESPDVSLGNTAFIMAAASEFNGGRYTACKRLLERCSFNDIGGDTSVIGIDQAGLLRGLCSMALGCWEESAEHFAAVGGADPGSPYRGKALHLLKQSRQGDTLPQKSGSAAMVFSALLPGSGQVYAGRAYDGFRHFVFNGLLIFSVYSLVDDEHYAAGYLLAGFTLPFYIGNIVGARNSAEHHNIAKRQEFVSRLIGEAGDK